jgi:hypothetical protein
LQQLDFYFILFYFIFILLWQEEGVAGELAVFLFNEKPSVKTMIIRNSFFFFLPLQPITVKCSPQA